MLGENMNKKPQFFIVAKKIVHTCMNFKNKYYLLIILVNFLPQWNTECLGKLKSIMPQTF